MKSVKDAHAMPHSDFHVSVREFGHRVVDTIGKLMKVYYVHTAEIMCVMPQSSRTICGCKRCVLLQFVCGFVKFWVSRRHPFEYRCAGKNETAKDSFLSSFLPFPTASHSSKQVSVSIAPQISDISQYRPLKTKTTISQLC